MEIGKKDGIWFQLDEFDPKGNLLNLSFHLGNKLISDEPVYTLTYLPSVKKVIQKLNSNGFVNGELDFNQPAQLFTIINQGTELSELKYPNHLLLIDETIDCYSIFILEKNDEVKIVWRCWDKNNCNIDHTLNEKYSVKLSKDELTSTLQKLLVALESITNHNK